MSQDLIIPGEDRFFGGTALFVDLIPASCWFTNARSALSATGWANVKQVVTERAGQCCEICGRGAFPKKRQWIEVHERWSYDDSKNIQRLERLIALCTACHRTTHFGLAQMQGRGEQALKHLMRVNSWTQAQAVSHIQEAFEVWSERTKERWQVDVSILTHAGYPVRGSRV